MSTSAGSDTLEHVDTRQVTDNGDHDKFSHYVKKAAIEASQLEGKPARALCGKLWNPTSDPEKYDVCPECKDVYENVVGTGPGANR